MRYVLLSLLVLTLVPAIASAGDRSRGGFSISVGGGYSSGGGWHGDRSYSHVQTSFRYGSDRGWRGNRHHSYHYNHHPVYHAPAPVYCPPPVVYYRPAPVYCPPPVVVYRPAPVYIAPCPPTYSNWYRPSHSNYSSNYGYGRYGR